jgi:hypothetical protein
VGASGWCGDDLALLCSGGVMESIVVRAYKEMYSKAVLMTYSKSKNKSKSKLFNSLGSKKKLVFSLLFSLARRLGRPT